MSLTGASAHPIVTVRFEYEPTSDSIARRPPPSIEVQAQLPVPSVGEVVVFRDENGSSSAYRVLHKRLWYGNDSRCVVTLSVVDDDAGVTEGSSSLEPELSGRRPLASSSPGR